MQGTQANQNLKRPGQFGRTFLNEANHGMGPDFTYTYRDVKQERKKGIGTTEKGGQPDEGRPPMESQKKKVKEGECRG